MAKVQGTSGYAKVVQQFIKSTESLPFEVLHRDFLAFFPTEKSWIVEVGAGCGRDAYELAKRGHRVIAVEPLLEFRLAGSKRYPSNQLQWIDDALPDLASLVKYVSRVDFVLASGVWHHLNRTEQEKALQQIAHLLRPGGVFVASLRNGPAGAGTHVFPTDLERTIRQASIYRLVPLLKLDHQPSLLKHKEKVKWSKLVLQKV